MEVDVVDTSSNIDIGGLRDQRIQCRSSPPIVCSRVCLIRQAVASRISYVREN
jgi:hypothetical protein